MSDQAFSLLHPGVQEAIWKMGWKDFKPIQVQSIHAVCETERNLVICAQTAWMDWTWIGLNSFQPICQMASWTPGCRRAKA